MSLIVISDESGCTGASYVKGSSLNYIISTVCFTNEDALKTFVETARSISRKHLGTPLRKWSELRGSVKNNPAVLREFVEDLFSNVSKTNPFVFSFFVLNKKEVEAGFNDVRSDKAAINTLADRGYTFCFKRIFPFVRRLHYVANRYHLGNPDVTWLIDINEPEFQQRLNKEINALAQNKINLKGPIFVSKKAENRDIATAIKIVDIIGGIVSRAFDQYSTHEECKERDCLSASSCQNDYIGAWKAILQHTTGISIRYNQQHVWKWQGILYAPPAFRSTHSRFFMEDASFQ